MNMRAKLLRIQRTERGLCERCDQPAVEGLGTCQYHRELNAIAGQTQRTRRRGGPPTRLFWCPRCQRFGSHYAKTCTQSREAR